MWAVYLVYAESIPVHSPGLHINAAVRSIRYTIHHQLGAYSMDLSHHGREVEDITEKVADMRDGNKLQK